MRVNIEADSSEIMGVWPIVSEGDYEIECVHKEDGTTKDKVDNEGNIMPGKPKVNLRFKIIDSEGAGIGSCFHTLTFIPKGEKGHGFLLHANKALGMPYDGRLDYDTEEYLGKRCRAHIIVDNYGGNQRNKIGDFISEKPEETPKPSAAKQPTKKAAPVYDPEEVVGF